MARFRDIPQFTQCAGYAVDVGLDYLPHHYAHYVLDYALDVSPDFQRGNVWTDLQKVRFMEYFLRGGKSGLDIYTNCPTWNEGSYGFENPNAWFVLVDGKQRLDAALGFLNNEFAVFGHYYRDFTDTPRIHLGNFKWHVNSLKTRKECLQWYLDLNCGGTVHTDDELDKVRELLKQGDDYVRPAAEVIKVAARVDRQVIQDALREDAEREAHTRLVQEERAAKERLELAARKAAGVAKAAATRAAKKKPG
jgi:hypothetical protein